jgi:superfamily I DNA and/or RNA helicase/very-short-patch-repair endonuclease
MESSLIKNEQFLKILKEKLSHGNKKSIHLNVLPERSATRIDLLDLNCIRKDSADKFMKSLLSKKQFKIELSLDEDLDINTLDEKTQKKLFVTIRRLKSICKQNTDYNLEHGIQPFGFGFPIIYKRDRNDPKNIIKAPLLIWSLEIIEDRKFTNKWIIKREEDFPVCFNDVLLTHIEKDENIRIERLDANYLEDSIIDLNELVEISNDLLQRFGSIVEKNQIELKLNQFVESTYYSQKEELITTKPALIGAGVFGLYINQKQSIIQDINLLIEESSDSDQDVLLNENFKINPFCSVDTDPTQQRILSNLSNNSRFIVHGPPGTGKSQSITAVITNALSNKAKCLVVCEKRTALDVIYKNLSDVGLEKLCGVVEDTTKDRRKIVDKARETIDKLRQTIYYYTPYNFDENEYTNLLDKTKTHIKTDHDFHNFLSKKIIGNKTWSEVVGGFLKNETNPNYKEIDDKLNYSDFSFSDKEYYELLVIIEKSVSLLRNYSPLNHPFGLFDFDYFKDRSIVDIKMVFDRIIPELRQEINHLILKNTEIRNECGKSLNTQYQQFYEEITSIITETDKLWKDNLNKKFFSKYTRINRLLLSVLGIIAPSITKTKKDQKRLNFLIEKLRSLVQNCIFCKFSIDQEYFSITNSQKLIPLIQSPLEDWFNQLHDIIQREIDKLSEGSNQTIEIANRVNEYLSSYSVAIDKINYTHIFKPIDYKPELYQVEAQLSAIKQELLAITEKKEDVNSYLIWERFLRTFPEHYQKLLVIISNYDLSIIQKLFKSWYFNHILNKNFINDLTTPENSIQNIYECLDSLKKETTKKALSYWQEKRIKSIYQFDNNHPYSAKQLYSKTNHNHEKKTLRQIIEQDFILFTDLFPVLLVNPSVCSSLFELKENLFDIVIFDEASQLRIEDTFCALIRGKIRIIAGDEHQMPPSSYFTSADFSIDSEEETIEVIPIEEQLHHDAVQDLANKESLLQFASDLKYEDIYLDIHYRSRHPLLIDFSNAAFYGNRLSPLPAKIDYKPIRFINVNGVYENQTNNSEAKQVIDILRKHISPKPDGNYPSIGIATFNIYQRNLIIDEIKKESNADVDFGKKIDLLYEKGLFIKNLENIQGDEKDIIIISTTFGKNYKKEFFERFGPLNISTKGHRLLNVIITRAKYKVYVCTSFPMEKIQKYREFLLNSGNIGRGVLYAYLAYAKAIEDGDITKIKVILDQLYENCTAKQSLENYQSFYGTESPFEEEVVNLLIKNGVPETRIGLQYQCGGFRIDFVIKSKQNSKPVIAIECDGATYHSSNEAYLWDVFRQKQLEEYGFRFYRIWSTDWWLSPDKEIQKILKFIQDFDLHEFVRTESLNDFNLIDHQIEKIEYSDLSITKASTVLIQNLKSNKQIKLRFTNIPQTKLFVQEGIQIIYDQAPIAHALIGKTVGDVCEIEYSGELFKILDISEN